MSDDPEPADRTTLTARCTVCDGGFSITDTSERVHAAYAAWNANHKHPDKS